MNKSLDYFVTSCKISLKRLKEYKINFWLSFFMEVVFVTSSLYFAYIIYLNLGDVIGWTYSDFVLFFFISNIIFLLGAVFLWTRGLVYDITRGDFNNYLVRPVNVFVQYIFNTWAYPVIVGIVLNIFILFFFVLTQGMIIVNLVKVMVYLLFILIAMIGSVFFFSSFNWIKLGLGNLLNGPNQMVSLLIRQYPIQFFESFEFKFVFFLMPSIFVSAIIIPLIKNQYNPYSNYYMIGLIFVIILFYSVTYFNWKKGLQKYSAFG